MASSFMKKDALFSSQKGHEIQVFSLENAHGMRCVLSNFGARLLQLWAPDNQGKLVDVVLGHDDIEDYIKQPNTFFGATVGRVANRTAGAAFNLKGKQYQLKANDGQNHLHGGPDGFHNQVWDAVHVAPNQITMTLWSADGHEGYPGNLEVNVTYTLTDGNALHIEYGATTDQDTPINLTNHSYFNLRGAGDISNHVVQIHAEKYLPINAAMIPTGTIETVSGSPFDFRKACKIADKIAEEHPQIILGKGFDHHFIPDGQGLRNMAKVFEPISGRTLEVISDAPGVQFYTGNFLDGHVTGKHGEQYEFRSGFCFETQHFPNSLNTPSFPSILLKAGEVYSSTCIYKFGILEID